MIIQNIFTNVLAVEEGVKVDNKKILKYCLDRDKKHKDKNKSIYFNFLESELRELFKVFVDRANDLHKNLQLSNNYRQELLNSWLNVGSTPYTSIPHNHNDTFGMMFSGVYYVKTDDDTSIEFVNPNKAHEFVLFPETIDKYNTFTSNTMLLKPKTGDLILFPSWLVHYVVNNKNNKNRISIAFNTTFKKNEETKS